MAYEVFSGDTADQKAKTEYYLRLFAAKRTQRSAFEVLWQEAAAILLPEYRNTFTFGSSNFPGLKQTDFQVDSTGAVLLDQFMAIAETLCTPNSMVWSVVRASDDVLMRDRRVQTYYSEVTKRLWKHRYRPEANFYSQNQQAITCNGAFGNGGVWTDELDTKPGDWSPGCRYISTPPGEIYLITNHQGVIVGCIRHFRWTAYQAVSKWGMAIPAVLRAAYEQQSQTMHDFLHFVLPRSDFDPYLALSDRGKPYTSCYLSMTGQEIVEEGGYRSFPLAYMRYRVAPGEDNGRGAGQIVGAEMKTLNAEKGDYLTQGHQAARPSYLVGDIGTMDFRPYPNSRHYGAVNEDGKEMVKRLDTGNIQVSKEMMDDSRLIMEAAFLTKYFPLLFNERGGPKSPREVIEQANDRGMFLAPMLGKINSEYIPALVNRELDVMSWLGVFDDLPLPDALKEARGEYELVVSSPLMRALSGQAITGYMRVAEFAGRMVEITGDRSWTDRLGNGNIALPAIADNQFVPPEWMATDQQAAAAAQARQRQAERDQRSKELPGMAAIEKAHAITAKAQTGGNIGGTLSGVPQGQMPQMPQGIGAAPSPRPSQFGQTGMPGGAA